MHKVHIVQAHSQPVQGGGGRLGGRGIPVVDRGRVSSGVEGRAPRKDFSHFTAKFPQRPQIE